MTGKTEVVKREGYWHICEPGGGMARCYGLDMAEAKDRAERIAKALNAYAESQEPPEPGTPGKE